MGMSSLFWRVALYNYWCQRSTFSLFYTVFNGIFLLKGFVVSLMYQLRCGGCFWCVWCVVCESEVRFELLYVGITVFKAVLRPLFVCGLRLVVILARILHYGEIDAN